METTKEELKYDEVAAKAMGIIAKQVRDVIRWNQQALLKNMSTSHIQNTIIMLAIKQEYADKYKVGALIIGKLTAPEWIVLLRKELEDREKDPTLHITETTGRSRQHTDHSEDHYR